MNQLYPGIINKNLKGRGRALIDIAEEVLSGNFVCGRGAFKAVSLRL